MQTILLWFYLINGLYIFRTFTCPSSGVLICRLFHCRMWCYAIGVEAVVLRSWCVVLCTLCQLVSNSVFMYLFIFLTLDMLRAQRAHYQERQIVSIQPLVAVTLYRWPWRVQVGTTCTRDQPAHTTRPPEVVLTQFVSPDDEHDVLETCRELKIQINT